MVRPFYVLSPWWEKKKLIFSVVGTIHGFPDDPLEMMAQDKGEETFTSVTLHVLRSQKTVQEIKKALAHSRAWAIRELSSHLRTQEIIRPGYRPYQELSGGGIKMELSIRGGKKAFPPIFDRTGLLLGKDRIQALELKDGAEVKARVEAISYVFSEELPLKMNLRLSGLQVFV